jgi:twitching motility two-component system response regulator PilG
VNNDLQQGGIERVYPRLGDAVAQSQLAPAGHEEVAPTLKLFVRGLERDERQLLEGLVRVSLRRSPRLEILDERDAGSADVVLIGATDTEAVAWTRRQAWVADKAIIWIGAGEPTSPAQSVIRRPVQWSILPILLARALEKKPGAAAAAAIAAAPGRTPARLPSRTSARSVLVVDDSLAIRNHLRSLLESGGFDVSAVDTVESALKVLAHQSFACVLMDVLMPGIDGYEGCRQIKGLLRGERAIPVVMLTSKTSPFDRIRGKMAGCDAYLTKPVDPQQLGDVLAQQLQR